MNPLKGCHTQTRRIAPFAVDDDPRCSSSEVRDASGLSVVTLSILSSCVETLFYPSSFYNMLANSDIIAWDK